MSTPLLLRYRGKIYTDLADGFRYACRRFRRSRSPIMTRLTFVGDDAAVSPVVGVILLIGITIALVALISPVVFEVSEEFSSAPPRASFEFTYTSDNAVTITHVGGSPVNGDRLSIAGLEDDDVDLSGQTYRRGDSLVTRESTDPEATQVRVVWTNPSGGSSNVIGSSIIPRR